MAELPGAVEEGFAAVQAADPSSSSPAVAQPVTRGEHLEPLLDPSTRRVPSKPARRGQATLRHLESSDAPCLQSLVAGNSTWQASVALVLAGCGGQPAPAATESTVSPAAVSTPPASPSAMAPESTISSEDPTAEATEVASDGESDKPPVLDKNATGRDLTTGDFFRTPDDWRDGRFNVAGKQAVAGVAGPLDDCEEQASDYSPTIELRLANNFPEYR